MHAYKVISCIQFILHSLFIIMKHECYFHVILQSKVLVCAKTVYREYEHAFSCFWCRSNVKCVSKSWFPVWNFEMYFYHLIGWTSVAVYLKQEQGTCTLVLDSSDLRPGTCRRDTRSTKCLDKGYRRCIRAHMHHLMWNEQPGTIKSIDLHA